MHAARGDAAEVGADIAAIRDARAVAEQQAAGDGRGQRFERHAPCGGEAARQTGGRQRAEHDPEVHHGRDVPKDAAVQFGGPPDRRSQEGS